MMEPTPIDPNDLSAEQLQQLREAQVQAMVQPQPVPIGWETRSIPGGPEGGAWVRLDLKTATGVYVAFLPADLAKDESGAVDLSSVSEAEQFGKAIQDAARQARTAIEVPGSQMNGHQPPPTD